MQFAGVRVRLLPESGKYSCREQSGGTRMKRRLAVVATLVALVSGLVAVGAPSAGATLTPSMGSVVLFVHGYNPTSTSTDCVDTFGTMIGQMRAQGFTGAMVNVGFYSGDTNCDVNLHSYASYGDRDSWKSIAAAFSKYVYNTYTSHSVTVDVVGYSMGGLIVRGAVYGAQSSTSGFSAPINVRMVSLSAARMMVRPGIPTCACGVSARRSRRARPT